MDGKLRNMTSVYLTGEQGILCLYRIGSRVANNKYVGACGGHFEENELSDPESCVLREEPVFCAMAAPKQAALSLDELLEQTDAGFSETLLKLIDKTGKKDSEIYKKAMISKQHFSKIRNNPDYRPTKPTAIALALALELDLEATRDLIGRAGYALTRSSKFDLIIQFFIEQGIYNIVEINCVLFDHDQSLLGG